MNDRELRKWIQDQSENIEIPASLEPENVVKQLEEKAKKKKTAYYRKVIGTAACLAVVAGIGAAGIAGVFGSRGNEGAGIQQAAEQEDETEFGKGQYRLFRYIPADSPIILCRFVRSGQSENIR